MSQIPEQAIDSIRKSARPRASLVEIRPAMSLKSARKFCKEMGWEFCEETHFGSCIGLKNGRTIMCVYPSSNYVSFWSR